MSPPKVLMVGAGAVGQGYAQALQRGGAQVHFFVKPHHEERLADGMPIREVGILAQGPLTDLARCPRLWDWDVAAQHTWDSIWLAVDGTALNGDWIKQLAAACGDATVVTFQTGTSGRAHLHQHLPKPQIVAAMIPFLAWWAPLSESSPDPDGPHMRVWHPPFLSTPLSGPTERVQAIADALRHGGIGAQPVANAAAHGAMGSAVLLPAIAGLERAGWRLRAFRAPDSVRTVRAAIQEARQITAQIHGVSPGLDPTRIPLLLPLVSWLGPRFTPLDLETYLQVHFTKVGAQTRDSLTELISVGTHEGLPTQALSQLHRAICAQDTT